MVGYKSPDHVRSSSSVKLLCADKFEALKTAAAEMAGRLHLFTFLKQGKEPLTNSNSWSITTTLTAIFPRKSAMSFVFVTAVTWDEVSKLKNRTAATVEGCND